MELKKYTELICKNCGSHALKKTRDYFICQNCRSLYKKKELKKRLIYIQSRWFWFLAVLIITVTVLVMSYGIAPQVTTRENKIEHPESWYIDVGPGEAYENAKEKEDADRQFEEIEAKAKWGLEHLNLTKVWTTEYFNSIQVAQMIFKDGENTPTYSNGMLFSDLVKKVGQPTTIKEGGPGYKRATFFYSGEEQSINHWSLSVFIVYDTRTGTITDKSVMG